MVSRKALSLEEMGTSAEFLGLVSGATEDNNASLIFIIVRDISQELTRLSIKGFANCFLRFLRRISAGVVIEPVSGRLR